MSRTRTYTNPGGESFAREGQLSMVELVVVYPAIFLIPALMFIEIRIVGRLFLSELILAGVLPFMLLTRGRALLEPLPAAFLFFAFLWLLGQVATDFIRATPFSDLARGWAKILNTVINFMAIYLITYRSRRRLMVFTLGVTVGFLLIYLFNPSDQMEEDPWKFGLGVSTALFFCTIASMRRVYNTGVLPVLCVLTPAVLSLMQGSRSMAGICFLAAAYVAFQFYIGSRGKVAREISPFKTVLLVVLGIGAAFAVLEIYSFAASQGYLGREAKYKYEVQSQGQFGILLGGRAEIYVSIQAISDSPIIGHGSWAKDPRYAAMLLKLENYGYEISSLSVESGLIPSHSHFFGAWVEAGILGAVFWLWVILVIVRVMIKLSLVRDHLTPLAAFAAVLLLWDVLFSPFGAERRILIPFYIIVLMTVSSAVDMHRRQSRKERKLLPRQGLEEGTGRSWWRKFTGQ